MSSSASTRTVTAGIAFSAIAMGGFLVWMAIDSVGIDEIHTSPFLWIGIALVIMEMIGAFVFYRTNSKREANGESPTA